MITRDSMLTDLPGVGEKTAKLYANKGIRTVGELLDFYPRDYDFFMPPVCVSSLQSGELSAVTLTILGTGRTAYAGRYKVTSFQAADATGEIRITFFNMPFLVGKLQAGSAHVFRGIVKRHQNGKLSLEHPAIYTQEAYAALENTYLPRYSLTKGLTNSSIMRVMKKALTSCALSGPALGKTDFRESGSSEKDPLEGSPLQADGEGAGTFRDLPEEDLQHLDLMREEDAVYAIHFPASSQELIAARNRKVFDEFLSFLLTIRRQKKKEQALVNTRPLKPSEETGKLIAALPYELTDAQKRAWKEIEADITGPYVMNRLLQGDVGSGKTILAFLGLLLCAANGRQGALMAPTEVLAEQHAKDLEELARQYSLPIRPVLLTGAVTGAKRKKALAAIQSGEANAVIGTHALIQDTVTYQDLALVITDEQHRFGVRQREALAGKGETTPVLVMSATPIPRTLSIILYGDLQVSRLTELPKNRLPIKNLAAPASQRGKLYRFILKEIAEGRQAYVICPAVEESGLEQMENVTDYTENLRKSLPTEIRIESLNGRMKPSEKNRIMTGFAAHEIDILVSTTVIEVGINVPNATCILIENAERFGLSQLHQLRGRVGRGKWQSYCMFLYSESQREKPKRLAILEKTNDGFEIAEQDLKLRGPGDLFGIRQSGEMGFHLADIYEDADILTKAAGYADEVLGKDPKFTFAGEKSVDFRSI